MHSTIRLEFNQSHLDYYTELDAVCLEGSRCRSKDFQRLPNDCDVSIAGENHMKLSHSDGHSHYCVQSGASVSIREYVTPMDILSRGFARLHAQNGLTAALDISDNGYFDLLPVGNMEVVVPICLNSVCNVIAGYLYTNMIYDGNNMPVFEDLW